MNADHIFIDGAQAGSHAKRAQSAIACINEMTREKAVDH
jgi:hypothetical protein